MFRVSINLFANSAPRVQDQKPAAEEPAARQGDWANEIAEVEKRLTEDDMRATFSEKFSASSKERLNKLA